MKKNLLLVVAVLFIGITKAQIVENALDISNIKAKIHSEGTMLQYGLNLPVEVPKGSGHYTIGGDNLWIGGYDGGGNLRIAGQTYRQTGTDFWPGPLTTAGNIDTATIIAYNRIWKINQCDIDAYTAWISDSGGIGPNPIDSSAMEVINTWPAANPDGEPLAPFIDLNGNGIYEPAIGEVPKIKGDQALFFVYNDKGGIHTETGGNNIGVEIQTMLYAYSCTADSALYNTFFINYKIINKSHDRLDSVFVGRWTEFEIGSYYDDFIGCDVSRGAYFGYNADSVDDHPATGMLAYGENPPAQAIVFLAGPAADSNGVDDLLTPNGVNYGDGIIDNERLGMSKFINYHNDNTVTGNPYYPSDYYNYLSGYWRDSTSLTYGGSGYSTGVSCDYMFPGNSDPLGYGTSMIPQPDWQETPGINPPTDGIVVASSGPFTFQPGATKEIDFAYVFGRATSGGNIASVNVMKERIDSVRSKFNRGITRCGCATYTGIDNLKIENTFSVFPNPASNDITIEYTSASKNYFIKIYDATGKLVKNFDAKGGINFSIADLKSGLYLLNVQDGNKLLTKRFIKQ